MRRRFLNVQVNVAEMYCIVQEMDKAWTLKTSPRGEEIIPCDDYRVGAIEHCCHELAHAVLLEVSFGPHLADRVGQASRSLVGVETSKYNDHWDASETNEVETFAVSIEALTAMGFTCEFAVFVEACEVQVNGGSRENIAKAIKAFMRTYQCRQSAMKIVETFEKWGVSASSMSSISSANPSPTRSNASSRRTAARNPKRGRPRR